MAAAGDWERGQQPPPQYSRPPPPYHHHVDGSSMGGGGGGGGAPPQPPPPPSYYDYEQQRGPHQQQQALVPPPNKPPEFRPPAPPYQHQHQLHQGGEGGMPPYTSSPPHYQHEQHLQGPPPLSSYRGHPQHPPLPRGAPRPRHQYPYHHSERYPSSGSYEAGPGYYPSPPPPQGPPPPPPPSHQQRQQVGGPPPPHPLASHHRAPSSGGPPAGWQHHQHNPGPSPPRDTNSHNMIYPPQLAPGWPQPPGSRPYLPTLLPKPSEVDQGRKDEGSPQGMSLGSQEEEGVTEKKSKEEKGKEDAAAAAADSKGAASDKKKKTDKKMTKKKNDAEGDPLSLLAKVSSQARHKQGGPKKDNQVQEQQEKKPSPGEPQTSKRKSPIVSPRSRKQNQDQQQIPKDSPKQPIAITPTNPAYYEEGQQQQQQIHPQQKPGMPAQPYLQPATPNRGPPVPPPSSAYGPPPAQHGSPPRSQPPYQQHRYPQQGHPPFPSPAYSPEWAGPEQRSPIVADRSSFDREDTYEGGRSSGRPYYPYYHGPPPDAGGYYEYQPSPWQHQHPQQRPYPPPPSASRLPPPVRWPPTAYEQQGAYQEGPPRPLPPTYSPQRHSSGAMEDSPTSVGGSPPIQQPMQGGHHPSPPQHSPQQQHNMVYAPYTYVQQPRLDEKTVLKKKFSWKHYPELERFLIANRDEYLRHSSQNYTLQQKQYNNWLTNQLINVASENHYVFDPNDFTYVAIRDRIRCYYKSYVQTARKRGLHLPANIKKSSKKQKTYAQEEEVEEEGEGRDDTMDVTNDDDKAEGGVAPTRAAEATSNYPSNKGKMDEEENGQQQPERGKGEEPKGAATS